MTTDTPKRSIPFLAFVRDNPWQIGVFTVTYWACMTEMHFRILGKWRHDEMLGGIWAPATPLDYFGPLLWAIPFVLCIYLMRTLLTHLHYRDTIDADANSGKYIADWNACTSFQRVLIATIVSVGTFIGMCYLVAPLARAGG